jgi:hypothetical protein
MLEGWRDNAPGAATARSCNVRERRRRRLSHVKSHGGGASWKTRFGAPTAALAA